MHRLRDIARRAALAAGAEIKARFHRERTVYEKAPKDIVTDTDRAAQAAALAVISETYPDHLLLAEEDPSITPEEGGVWRIPRGVTWIVDPVDGTANYTTHLPFFCTSIGVALDGEPAAGAIYDPVRDELFLAERGEGVTLNDEPLPPVKPNRLYDSMLSIDWARAPGIPYSIRDVLFALAPRVRTTRVLGSAALAMTYVAAGRLQMYCNVGLKPWDAAAAAVFLLEAGAGLRTPDGDAWVLGHPALITAHPDLLDAAVRAFTDRG